MLKQVFILNTCNAHHTADSMCAVGAFSSLLGAVAAAEIHARLSGFELSSHDMYLLENIKQTQGLDAPEPFDEYYIEVMEVDNYSSIKGINS